LIIVTDESFKVKTESLTMWGLLKKVFSVRNVGLAIRRFLASD